MGVCNGDLNVGEGCHVDLGIYRIGRIKGRRGFGDYLGRSAKKNVLSVKFDDF